MSHKTTIFGLQKSKSGTDALVQNTSMPLLHPRLTHASKEAQPQKAAGDQDEIATPQQPMLGEVRRDLIEESMATPQMHVLTPSHPKKKPWNERGTTE